MRRLRSREDRRTRGSHDGLYLVNDAPVALCELERYDALHNVFFLNLCEDRNLEGF